MNDDRLLESYVSIIKEVNTNKAKKILRGLIRGGGRVNRLPGGENRMRRVLGMPGVVRNTKTGILYRYNANSGRYRPFNRSRIRNRNGSRSRSLSERQLLELLGGSRSLSERKLLELLGGSRGRSFF